MRIHVTPYSRVAGVVVDAGADRLVSLMSPGIDVERPATIAPPDHLLLTMHDISEERAGFTSPGEEHIVSLLDFARDSRNHGAMVIHCLAGISRSTAAAVLIAAALMPDRDEADLARQLRQRSPTASPNRRMIALGDRLLAREGRLSRAIEDIGRGTEAFEGVPFWLEVGDA